MASQTLTLVGFALWLLALLIAWRAWAKHAPAWVGQPDPWIPSWCASTGSGSDGSAPRRRRKPCSTDPALPLTLESIVARRALIASYLKSRGVRQADIEDLTALVIEGTWNSRESWSPKLSRFDSFLWAIARNVAAAHARRPYQRRVDVVDPCAFAALVSDDTPESLLEAAEEQAPDRIAKARAIVAKLSPRMAAVFTLYEVEGWSMVTVSTVLGVQLSTCWGRLQSARVRVAALVARASAIEARRRRAPRPR